MGLTLVALLLAVAVLLGVLIAMAVRIDRLTDQLRQQRRPREPHDRT